jgi:hypothetical protein
LAVRNGPGSITGWCLGDQTRLVPGRQETDGHVSGFVAGAAGETVGAVHGAVKTD